MDRHQKQSNSSSRNSSSSTSYWTNERHGNFLNSLEASFVRSVFGNHEEDQDPRSFARLDRVLPDSSESTLDSESPGNENRRRRYSSTDIPRGRVDADKASRRQSSRSFASSQDQVVPQLKYGKEDKDAENNVDASQDLRRNRP